MKADSPFSIYVGEQNYEKVRFISSEIKEDMLTEETCLICILQVAVIGDSSIV